MQHIPRENPATYGLGAATRLSEKCEIFGVAVAGTVGQ
jgi:hypothetical protein